MEKYLNLLLKISLALVILAIPLKPLWVSYSLILLGLVGLVNIVHYKKWEAPPLTNYMLMGAYFVRILWLFVTDDISYGLRCLETEFPLLVIPILLSLFKFTHEHYRFAIKVYVLMFMLLMTYSFVQLAIYMQDSPWTFYDYTKFHLEPSSIWANSRYFARNMLNWQYAHYSFISVSIIYGLHCFYFLKEKTYFEKVLLVAYIIMTVLFLIYTGSRVGFVLFIIGIFFYLLFSIKQIKDKLFPVIVILFFLGLIVFFTKWENIDSKRYHYAVRAKSAWLQHAWMGYGTGAGRIIMQDPEFEKETGESVNHPHNQYLSELIQFGIVGSLPLFLFFMLTVWKGVHKENKALLMVMITALIFMLVESPINSNKGIVPLLFIITLLTSNSQISEPQNNVRQEAY